MSAMLISQLWRPAAIALGYRALLLHQRDAARADAAHLKTALAEAEASNAAMQNAVNAQNAAVAQVRDQLAEATRSAAASARRAMAACALAAALTSGGCAGGPAETPAARPLTVQVPMLRQIPCPAATPADPPLPIASLKPDSPPADTMRAYAAAVAILKRAVRERDAMLAGCAGGRQAPHL